MLLIYYSFEIVYWFNWDILLLLQIKFVYISQFKSKLLLIESRFLLNFIMSKRMSKVQEQQKALLDALTVVTETNYSMVGDLVTKMVNSIPKIAEQRKDIERLVGEINKLPTEVQSGNRH